MILYCPLTLPACRAYNRVSVRLVRIDQSMHVFWHTILANFLAIILRASLPIPYTAESLSDPVPHACSRRWPRAAGVSFTFVLLYHKKMGWGEWS